MLIDNVINFLKEQRQNIIEGRVNCIPSPFTRFRSDFVGIEKGMYYLVSAAQKCGKTQFASRVFIYSALEYAFENPEKLRVKIFYYPLEESTEQIVTRYMSYLLYKMSEGRIRISPKNLESVDERKVLPEKILNLLESDDYQERLRFFEDHIVFSEERNPTGMFKEVENYMKLTGEVVRKEYEYVDTSTGEITKHKKFDHYEPSDKNEYVMWFVDHLSLINTERNMDLRESINKLSEYAVVLRNRYKVIPVFVQQQSTETFSLDAFKAKKIRPTASGLADSKYTAKDCSMMIGLSSPNSFEIPEYMKYNITDFGDNIRFMEIVLNRHGNSNGMEALYFDGSTCTFNELPRPENVSEIARVLRFIRERDKIEETKGGIMLFNYVEKHNNYISKVLKKFFI